MMKVTQTTNGRKLTPDDASGLRRLHHFHHLHHLVSGTTQR